MNRAAIAERPAIFLDRDGTVIEDVGYLRDPGQVQMLPGAGPALRLLQDHGFALVVVSNQSGIGRGWITPGEAEQVHERMRACLAAHGVSLDAVYYCPHAPDARCPCRKPSPEMILRAAQELDLDRARSFLVGDKATDIQAGQRAGCYTILLTPAAALLGPSWLPISRR